MAAIQTWTIFHSKIKENIAYCGLITYSGGGAYLYDCLIVDHHVVGSSVVGTFCALASLTLVKTDIINNTLEGSTLMGVVQPALIVFFTATFTLNNVNVIGGSVGSGGLLILSNIVQGYMNNVVIQNFHRQEYNEAPLIHLTYSKIYITNMFCSNVTGVFEAIETELYLTSVVVQDVKNIYLSQFLVSASHAYVYMTNVQYIGNGEYNSIIPLIGGNPVVMYVIASQFIDATGGQNSIIKLTSPLALVVKGCMFANTAAKSQVSALDLTSPGIVLIENSLFQFIGTVSKATGVLNAFYFTSNIVFTDSYVQSISLSGGNLCSFVDNIFMGYNGNGGLDTPPESFIQISDSYNTTTIRGNVFTSLYDSNGIIEMNARVYSYIATIQRNTFVGNTASHGGAIYLSAQNKGKSPIAPTAYIRDSIFVMNKAVSSGSVEGKGGALYQNSL